MARLWLAWGMVEKQNTADNRSSMPGLRRITLTRRAIALCALALLLVLAVLSRTALTSLSHDEHMYITAGVLAQSQSLYTDFAYLQMPYLPAIYSTLFDLTGSSHYVLWARLLTFLFVCLSAALLFVITRRQSRSLAAGIGCVILFLCCHPVLYVMPHAWNHVLSLTLLLLAMHLFLRSVHPGRAVSAQGLLLAGAAIGLAIGVKLTYAFVPFVLLATLLSDAALGPVHRRLRVACVPLMAGMILTLLPALIVWLRTDSDVAWFNNVGFHQLNAVWRTTVDASQTSLATKAKFLWQELGLPVSVCLILATFLLVTLTLRGGLTRLRAMDAGWQAAARLGGIGVVAASVAAALPTPLYPSYFVMPVPFVLLTLAVCYRTVPEADRRTVDTVLVGLLVVTSLFGGVRLLQTVPGLLTGREWTGRVVHRESHQIRDLVGADRINLKVATLAPIYALESGLNLYPELATGPFLYRVGDLLSAEQRRRYVGTSPGSLDSLFREDPPGAILVGFEEEALEEPLISYARRHRYQEHSLDNGGVLFLRVRIP